MRDLVAAGNFALPFHLASGWRTQHVFTARFRGDNRPHIRRFRDWLLAEAAGTRAWLEDVASGRLTTA